MNDEYIIDYIGIALILMLAFLCGLTVCTGCAQEHGRIEGLPLYVHLCDAMPRADREAWGEAAGAINAGAAEPVLWVGHGPPTTCNTVDVCAGPEDLIGDNGCTVFVRYVPGGEFDSPHGLLVASMGHAR